MNSRETLALEHPVQAPPSPRLPAARLETFPVQGGHGLGVARQMARARWVNQRREPFDGGGVRLVLLVAGHCGEVNIRHQFKGFALASRGGMVNRSMAATTSTFFNRS